nr:PREDICTED: adaptin ear-binding coat-associated protein 2 [Struthio camelus australis]
MIAAEEKYQTARRSVAVSSFSRAAEWQLDQPAWSGRLRITAKGKIAFIKLEDKTSGELFAQAPVDQFPGIAVEGVTDSSRYFVIRIEDGNGTATVCHTLKRWAWGNHIFGSSQYPCSEFFSSAKSFFSRAKYTFHEVGNGANYLSLPCANCTLSFASHKNSLLFWFALRLKCASRSLELCCRRLLGVTPSVLPCSTSLQQTRSRTMSNIFKELPLRCGADLGQEASCWLLTCLFLFASCRWVRQQSELAKQAENPDQGPKLDLGFKEGQTIKLNIANMKKKEGATGNAKPRPPGPGGLSLLPPPPGGKSSTPVLPSGERPSSLSTPAQAASRPSADSLLAWPQPSAAPSAAAADIWGDFAKASGSASNQNQANAGWVQF